MRGPSIGQFVELPRRITRRIAIGVSLVMFFFVACNSTETTGPPQRPTPDIEATVEALVQERLSETLAAAQKWNNEFPSVMNRVNAAMITPATALLETYGCENQEDCDTALKRLPRALGPATEELQKEITTLAALEPPSRYRDLHNSYLQTLKLRLEAFELYIAAVEENDNALLEAGGDVWLRAQKRQTENLALTLEFLREDGGLSPEAAWMTELVGIQQAFLQNEAEIAPTLEAVWSCETAKECDSALRALPSALRPGQTELTQYLVTLGELEPPAKHISCSTYQSGIHRSFQLRLDAYDFYIRGVEESNDNLLEAGDLAWTQSMDAAADVVASQPKCAQSFQSLGP